MQTKRLRTFVTIVQSVLIVIMMILVTSMIFQINSLQGTARVINYAGIVRGATQREVKLEIVGQKNDDLIVYLDEILDGLKNESRKYNLVRLEDEVYQADLDKQMQYWQKLKDEIYRVREYGYEATDIVEVSENYFRMADETVSAAELYSESIATVIRYLEIGTAVDITILILIMLFRSLEAVRIRHRNSQLEQKAFTDQHTGLPNKGRCEEFFTDADLMQQPVGCIVFDLNNLKVANDTLGHSVGDQLIENFARLLRNAIPAQNFVGRYGGDEFMAVIYDASREKIEKILGQIQEDVQEFNRLHHGGSKFVEVSYACGWVLSTDFPDCSFRVLFDKADKNMYENKLAKRKQRI
ncbi:MAG: GGDEF domain-containing protein [Frisingicoccus sp.]|uniref:GGDEF domain-containing protein n=1 Tax=Frisingicoccus sp. TaxID=1918627 RepID=UPI002A7FA612|nr:GGDEF domain-containing protein [Frisingicoccus sp.]MDY4834326.1 GGDEF domain-containing protein [Frisingicoccus sp.]